MQSLVILLLFLSTLYGFTETTTSLSPNDVAQFLAGIKTGKLAEENSPGNELYRTGLTESWQSLEKNRLIPMRRWAATELGSVRDNAQPVYYPFSGPDFIHVYAFFPKGTTYYLGGLEPIGALPDLTKMAPENFTSLYTEVQASLTTLISLSFFKTNDMKKDFSQSQLNGVVPILAIFMARSGLEVKEIDYVRLSHDGSIKIAESKINGARIIFQRPGKEPQTLYYFQVDVSDDGAKGPALNLAIERQGSGVTYLKSASYLMHRNSFSLIREALLKSSTALLEDDSGIPLKCFNGTDWKVAAYGNYVAPIDLFKERFQADLWALYDKIPKPKLLPFGIGYKYSREESMLLWATRIPKN